MRGGMGKSSLLNKALEQKSYSTDSQAVEVEVARTPATQYLTLNSRDRNQNSVVGGAVRQPWNNFKLQRPQSIMNSFSTRILVCEVNFPWFVPNINDYNKRAGIQYDGGTVQDIVIPEGFYTPQSIVAFFNAEVPNPPGIGDTPPALSYDATRGVFTITSGNVGFILNLGGFAQLQNPSAPTFWETLGFDAFQISQPFLPGGLDINGSPTQFLYTQYVDIVSNKFNQYSAVRDGSSDSNTNSNLICRLFICDEASIVYNNNSPTPGQFPSIIHRQFKNAKAVMWNKEAVIDWLDISLLDEFGNLLPLPPYNIGGATVPSYPDFQITLLASEN